MKRLSLLIFSTVFMLSSSCKKDTAEAIGEPDYLIFGHFYGMCQGEECVETYKLTSNALFEDTNDSYSNPNFQFQELGNNLFVQVDGLEDDFPNGLWNASESTFGCPDCADQGGMLIQYSVNGVVKTWRIDNSKNAVPTYLHPFMDKVREKIDLINK